jgi:alkanesulfonate monooxygenase SsuD/methylene tetrahydromethanopterin reductase-like flavin-dependent oxidoreductase (luciferase family)
MIPDTARATFGLYVENLHPEPDDLGVRLVQHREQIELARQAGFTSLVFGQHLLTKPIQMPAPIPHLTSAIDISGSMTLCTGVLLLPLFNPVLLAEDLASVDWLSGGRLVVGVGLGYRPEEYAAAGVAMTGRVSRFNEAVAVMRKVWESQDGWSFQGKHFSYEGLPGGLRPVQRPHPPFWVAADADNAVRRAGRMGAAWYINPRAQVHTLSRQLPIYQEELAANGHTPPTIFPIRREAFVGRTDAEARQMAVKYLKRQLELYRRWGQYDIMPDADARQIEFSEDDIPDTYLVGTAERVADLIDQYVEALGVNHFVLRMQWPGTPQDVVLRSITGVGERLVPRFASGGMTKPASGPASSASVEGWQ